MRGGTLYGTTSTGGAGGPAVLNKGAGCGTVFSVTPSGVESIVYSFGAAANDADYPLAGLINVNGALYGTTYLGGVLTATGTVFSVTPGGVETVVYSFKGGSDGAGPQAGSINVGGTLYGTTTTGGGQGGTSCSGGCGTVFAITP